jgi:hypothetical protein
MDYLFVPGDSREDRLGRAVLRRLPNTVLITPRRARNHVAGLLAHLAALPSTPANQDPRPIGDLLFLAHGLRTGEYFIPLTARLGSPADFEKADAANAANTVRLTAPLLEPAGGGPLNTITVRMRGCNFGRATPFVERLRDAMTPAGGSLDMTAPLHFDEFHGILGGTLEFLAHKFTLSVNERFRLRNGVSARDQLLEAFGDEDEFTYLDGTEIADGDWTQWVANNIHPPRRRWKQPFDISVDLDPPANGQTSVMIHGEYRYESVPFSWDWSPPDRANHQVGNQLRQPTPDELELLRDTLPLGRVPNRPGGLHLYDPSYEWPLYMRYGFADLDDYVDNLEWRVTFDGRTLHYRAVRHEYTVMLPITDPPAPPARPVLRFYNYLPNRPATGPEILNLDENNDDLFLSV